MECAPALVLGSHMAVAAVLSVLLHSHQPSSLGDTAGGLIRTIGIALSLYTILIGLGFIWLPWSVIGTCLRLLYPVIAVSVAALLIRAPLAKCEAEAEAEDEQEEGCQATEPVTRPDLKIVVQERENKLWSPSEGLSKSLVTGRMAVSFDGVDRAMPETAGLSPSSLGDNLAAKRLSLSADDAVACELSVEIMCVDDDKLHHVVMQRSLVKSNFVLTSAFSGAEALSILEARFAEGGVKAFPTMMLLDVNTGSALESEIGYAIVSEIRGRYPSAALPIIMVSSAHDTETVVRSLRAGANDFISKPFCRKTLTARIAAQLRALEFWENQLESQRNELLLKQMLPESVISRLTSGIRPVYDNLDEVSILFSDIVGFTTLASVLPTEKLIHMLDTLFTEFDDLTDKHGVYKVETIGDAYMVVAGHDKQSREDHATRLLNMAADMVNIADSLMLPNGSSIQIRVGIHSGPAYAGVVGRKMPRYCLFGDTVNVASRMESNSFPQCIHVSQTTYTCYKEQTDKQKLLASSILADPHPEMGFLDLGHREIKGKGLMHTWLVEGVGNSESAFELYGERKSVLRRSIDGSAAVRSAPAMTPTVTAAGAAMPWQLAVSTTPDAPSTPVAAREILRRRSSSSSRSSIRRRSVGSVD